MRLLERKLSSKWSSGFGSCEEGSCFSLFIDETKVTSTVRDHLKSTDGHRVEILPYNAITDRLAQYRDKYPESRFWLSGGGTSLALVKCIPDDRSFDKASPVLIAKAQKNPVEMQGMKNCHVSRRGIG